MKKIPKSIPEIVKKNLKLLIRSKTSALVVIFGPLLIIFLVGVAFDNSNIYKVNIGVYSEQYNYVSESFTEKLSSKQFRVKKYDSEPDCIDNIKQGNSHACIVFAPDFTVGDKDKNEITFHIDYSKINLVWAILDLVSSKVEERSAELSKDLTEILIKRLELTKQQIKERTPTIVQLAEDNANIGDEIKLVDEKINSLSFEINADDFKISDLTTFNNELKENMETVKTNTESRLAKIIESLDDIDRRVKSQGNETDGNQAMIDDVVNIKGHIEGINYKLSTSQNLSLQDWEEIKTILETSQASLDTLSGNLGQASTVRDEINGITANINSLLDTNLVNIGSLKESLELIYTDIENINVTDASDIVKPIKTTIKPLTSEKTHLNYLFPSLMILVIMFISILLSSTLVVMEKQSKAYFRNFITPTKNIIFIISTFLTSMIIIILQILIILLVSSTFFKAQVLTNLHITLLILILTTAFFTLLGMTIGYLFDSEETATLGGICVGTLCLLLSNVIVPIESMPDYLIKIVKFNPFVIAESLLSKSFLFHLNIKAAAGGLLTILLYSVIFFVIICILQDVIKKRYIFKYTRGQAPVQQKKAKK